MTTTVEAAARAYAAVARCCVPIRDTRAVIDDPSPAFGICFLRVVAEEAVEAIAFGRIDRAPQIVVRWNPLSRDSAPLEPFADALNTYVTDELAAGRLPRIWLPHNASLTILDLLGRRYERNKDASESLRRMGWQCRAIANECTFEGQQAVIVATDLIRRHVVTGQSPSEDAHLGALLAWVDPVPGREPLDVATERALMPASAMLQQGADTRVEALRRIAKGRGAGAEAARSEIERILADGVLSEWQMLIDARAAFLRLPLAPATGLQSLVDDSLDRLRFRLTQYVASPSRAPALARLLKEHEHAIDVQTLADVRGDRQAREAARRAGRVAHAKVIAINQPRRNFNPCTITLEITQEVLRVRVGSTLQELNGRVKGRIGTIRATRAATVVELGLTNGVRSVPPVGSEADWTTETVFDGRQALRTVWQALAATPPAIIGDDLPAPAGRTIPDADLGVVLARVRAR